MAIDIYEKIKIFNTLGDLSYFRGKLADSNPARYRYMDQNQRHEERTRLINTMLLIRMEAEEHMNRKRKAKLKQCCNEIQSCCDKIAQLDDIDNKAFIKIEAGREKPLSYLCLYAHLDTIHESTDPEDVEQVKKMVQEARDFASIIKKLDDPLTDNIDVMRQFVGVFNDNRRTHWTAGVSTMTAFLEYLRNDYTFPYQTNLETGINSFSWTMGSLSAFIYFFRLFGVELNEAVSEAISDWQPVKGALVSKKKNSKLSRLWNDISGMRKYIILNDLLWGTVNLLTFVYLTGPLTTTVGFVGAYLTLAFLVVDVLLTCARFAELERDYKNKEKKLYDQEDALTKELELLQSKLQELPSKENQKEARKAQEAREAREEIENKIIYLQNTIKDLQKARATLELDWRYKKYALWAELSYSAGLIGAYSLMCGCFVVGIAGALTMGLVGAGLWFILAIAYAGANVAIESSKIKTSVETRRTLALDLIKDFNEPNIADDKKRMLYLNIKELVARNNYDQEYINFLRKKTIVRTLMHLSVPIVIFSSMVFLPLMWAAPVIIGFVAILCFINWRINIWLANIQPLKNDSKFFPSFDPNDKIGEKYEKQYLEFAKSKEALTFDKFEESPIKLPIDITPKNDDDAAAAVNLATSP